MFIGVPKAIFPDTHSAKKVGQLVGMQGRELPDLTCRLVSRRWSGPRLQKTKKPVKPATTSLLCHRIVLWGFYFPPRMSTQLFWCSCRKTFAQISDTLVTARRCAVDRERGGSSYDTGRAEDALRIFDREAWGATPPSI